MELLLIEVKVLLVSIKVRTVLDIVLEIELPLGPLRLPTVYLTGEPCIAYQAL
jgi:hypothetical protein